MTNCSEMSKLMMNWRLLQCRVNSQVLNRCSTITLVPNRKTKQNPTYGINSLFKRWEWIGNATLLDNDFAFIILAGFFTFLFVSLVFFHCSCLLFSVVCLSLLSVRLFLFSLFHFLSGLFVYLFNYFFVVICLFCLCVFVSVSIFLLWLYM